MLGAGDIYDSEWKASVHKSSFDAHHFDVIPLSCYTNDFRFTFIELQFKILFQLTRRFFLHWTVIWYPIDKMKYKTNFLTFSNIFSSMGRWEGIWDGSKICFVFCFIYGFCTTSHPCAKYSPSALWTRCTGRTCR